MSPLGREKHHTGDSPLTKTSLGDPFTVYGASYVRPPVEPVVIDKPLKDGDVFTWRGYSLRCLDTPGNSPGSMSYVLERQGQSFVFSGDVETFYPQGRYHVFYLYDRRHHQSKFGCGAHYFEHFSTTDFARQVGNLPEDTHSLTKS